jgi:iron complex outermembrane receptor protein
MLSDDNNGATNQAIETKADERMGGKFMERCLTGIFTVGATLLVASHAAAQEPSAPTPEQAAIEAQRSEIQLEDIVVTAQRRAERLQDVPISVSAITGDAMGDRGVTNAFSLQAVVPGFSVTRVGTVATPYLRGVGTDGGNPNTEPSVATYVDGVYYAAPFANLYSFNNVERIEVLKGPQGTLFGRNATGGVVQIVTRRPSQTPLVEAYLGYGNFDTYEAGGYATTGLGENAALDAAVQYKDQQDGWGRNVVLDKEIHKSREFSFRSKLLLTPGELTEITVTGDYNSGRNSYASYNRAPGVPDLDGVVRNLGRYDSAGNQLPDSKNKSKGVAVRIEHDLDFARLVSISAYRRSSGTFFFDYDTSPIQIVSAALVQRAKTISQELQLVSPSDGAFDWTLGAYYFDAKTAYDPGRLCGPGIVPTGCQDINGFQHTKSVSPYAQASLEVTDGTTITAGLRFTHEEQRLTGGFQASASPRGATTGPFTAVPARDQSFEKLTWRIAVDQQLKSDVKVYASYNRGVKSGGFNLQGPGDPGFRPEILDAYEIGLKSELLDRRVRLNIAAFYYDFQDIQVSIVQNNVSVPVNAAKARIKGIDADFAFAASPELIVTANAAYVDGKFKDFPNPTVFPQSAFDAPVILANAAGNPTTRTPKFTGSIGADYEKTTDAGIFGISTNLYHNSGFAWEPSNRLRQKSYELLNASVRWTSPDETFTVKLWAQNLTNTKYLSQGQSTAVGDLLIPASPRTYGLTLSTRFQP